MSEELDQRLFDRFDQQGEVRHGLPAVAYTDTEFFRLEARYLFASSWVFVAFAHDLPRVGDVAPITVAGKPVLLVRSAQDRIRAFHNVCRHRNLKLVDQPGHCSGLITCPYHRWSYDLEGGLRLAPYLGGEKTSLPDGFRLEDNGLEEILCTTFHDWVFVNLDADAPDFESFIAPLRRQLGSFKPDEFVPVAAIEFGELRCNWKLLMENFIEPYHVQFVHKTTTSQPLEDHIVVIDGHCLGSAVELASEQQRGASPDTLGVSSRYLTLFPNLVLGLYHPDQLGVHLNQPVSVDTTAQKRVIYLHRDSDHSEAAVDPIRQLWEKVHREDHAICERLQEGRQSDVAGPGGLLSPHWEASVRRFQELVADAMRPVVDPAL